MSTVGRARTVMLAGPKGSIFVATNPSESSPGKKADELIFHRVNSEYFLASIWTADSSVGFQLFRSRHEREMVAQIGTPAVEVLFAAAR